LLTLPASHEQVEVHLEDVPTKVRIQEAKDTNLFPQHAHYQPKQAEDAYIAVRSRFRCCHSTLS